MLMQRVSARGLFERESRRFTRAFFCCPNAQSMDIDEKMHAKSKAILSRSIFWD